MDTITPSPYAPSSAPLNHSAPSVPPHHAPNGLKLWLLIFAVVLIAVLGYLVWQANNTSTDMADSTPLHPKKTATTKATVPTTDPTADWKTYTNSGLKFSFKYPSTFTVADNLQASGAGTTASQQLVLTDATTTGKPNLTILVDPAGFDGSPTNLLYTFKLDANDKLSTVTTAKQTVDTSVLGDSTHYIAGTALGGQLLNGKTFVIRYSYLTGNDSLLTTFDEMIKTFTITK